MTETTSGAGKVDELFDAIDRGDKKSVQRLLGEGIDANTVVDVTGREYRLDTQTSPLHDAVGKNRADIVECLLDHGADPNLSLGWRETPLRTALMRGLWPIVRLLVERGADVDCQTKYGCLLHEMVTFDKADAVRQLLYLGADDQIRNNVGSGQTPLQLARKLHKREKVSEDIVFYLESPEEYRQSPTEDYFTLLDDYKGWSGRLRLRLGLVSRRERELLERVKQYDFEAMSILGKIGDDRHYRILLPMLTNLEVNRPAANTLAQLGWEPADDTEQVHYQVACQNQAFASENWDLTKRVLLQDIHSGDGNAVWNALFFFIRFGNQDVIPDLAAALDTHGTPFLAETYLNCGQEDLADAAERWALLHGYEIKKGDGAMPVTWNPYGELRKRLASSSPPSRQD